MTSFRLSPKFSPYLRTIIWKTSFASIASAVLGHEILAAIASGELPVAVPPASASALAGMRAGNIHWVIFQLLGLAIPVFFLFSGLGARLRQRCENICGGRRFCTVTLFVCAYLVLAALMVLPFSFYVYYV
jgi:hypothetical protein